MLDAVIRAANIGGKVLMKNFDNARRLKYDRKKGNDYVSEVDHKSQREIIRFIESEFPDHAILAEEDGGGKEGRDFRWIIDPLDGTTNYLHGFPVFTVSIALEEYHPSQSDFGPIKCGAVLNPVLESLYYAESGKGAYKNSVKIYVNENIVFDEALLATGFPFRDKDYLDNFLTIFKGMFDRCSGVRRAGSAAQDLCWVAEGALDGFWEKGLSPWDVAAGAMIVQEAQGSVMDFSGGNNFIGDNTIIACSKSIRSDMMEIIRPSLT